MRKFALFAVVIMFCFLFLASCNKSVAKNEDKSTGTSITDSSEKKADISMTFAKLPSPPKCKKTNDSETIRKITDYMDGYEKVSSGNQDIKGWQMLVTVTLSDGNRKQYSVIGDMLKIDNTWYRINDDFKSKLEKLYDQMDVPEEKY